MPGAKYSLHRVRASRGEHSGTFFDGVVLKIDFEELFPAHTVIVPDQGNAQAGAPPGRKKDLVMMKHPAFEQSFDVYSTDYYEARKVVTPYFMQLLLDAHARLRSEMRLCFLGRSLFVTVEGNALQLTPTLFGERLTPQTAMGTAHLVALAQRFAETRIQGAV
jgi:hypothetical protein